MSHCKQQQGKPSGRLGAALAAVAMLAAVPLAMGQPVGVTIDRPDYYLYEIASVPAEGGEVAFDPTDSNRPYIAMDGGSATGSGIYRGGYVDGVLVAVEQVVALDNPSGIAFTSNGDLYIVQDFTQALRVVRTPRTGAPYTTEQIIGNFGTTTTDDDPICVVVAPAGFDGTNVSPGDLVIPDRGYDNNNNKNAIFAYTPGEAITEPFNRLLTTAAQLVAYDSSDLNDVTFSKDGTSLYAIFSSGKVIEINAEGAVVRELTPVGVTFGTLQAIGTNPIDGRLWIGDDTKDEVWSVDPATSEARRELKFTRTGSAFGVHFPGLQFSNDGEYFTVGDVTVPGYLFLFKRRAAGNNPPTAVIVTTPSNGIAPPSEGVATVTLDATTSTDGDGGTQGLTYQWYYLGTNPSVVIMNPNSAVTTASIPNVAGRYAFALRVSDGQAVNNVAVAEASFIVPTEATIEIPTGSYFKSGRSLFMARTPGDIAIDTADSDKIYIANDDSVANGGGVYRIDRNLNGSYAIGEKVLALDGISSLAMTADGMLYWLRDGTGSVTSPYFGKLATPRSGPPYVNTGLISNFGPTTADDDPFSMRVVPAGFEGPNVHPGDILIDDAGAEADTNNVIFVYTPPNAPATPAAYNNVFMSQAQLAAINGTINLNDMEFSADGTRLYLAFDNGVIVAVDSGGNVTNSFAPTGVAFANVEGIAVNPADGRIFVADDNLDQIWSFDPNDADGLGGAARKEVQFRLPGESRADFQINFHDPTLAFTHDGKRLIVTDTGLDTVTADGWIWVLDVTPPPLQAPDFDSDNDVDVLDMIAFSNCALGPKIMVTDVNCVSADLDHDGDADQTDFAIMQRCFSGDSVPWAPICKN